MSDKPKTLAAILAEMRGNEFDDPHLDADGIIGARRLARDWADRIEAAAERERQDAMKTALLAKCKVCEKVGPASAPGNASALREALRDIRQYVRVWIGTDVIDRTMAERIVATCDAALDAPARNCDRFDCVCTAQREFRRAFRDPYSNPAPSGDDPAYWPLVVNWLFAPAEGGAK